MIFRFKKGKKEQMQKNVIVFDTETNGFNDCSVLSISAVKLKIDLENKEIEKIGKFDRYYFRKQNEEINKEAIKINGLTDEEITKKRNGEKYSKYFLEDKDFIDFCRGIKHFVAHNISFDSKFMPFELENQFCTKETNIEICKLPSGFNGKYKWPRLSEAAEFYKIEMDEEKWHGSEYDTQICAEIFRKMLQREETYLIVKKFLEKN